MTNFTVFELLYYGMAGSYLIAWVAALMQKPLFALPFGGIAFAGNLFTFFLISFTAGRPPIYGHFEIIVQICAILGWFGLWDYRKKSRHPEVSRVAAGLWAVALFLLAVLYFFPKEINADFYMYNRATVLIFFNFRITAAAFFLLAAVHTCIGIFGTKTNNASSNPLYKGRNFLLIGTICFLISECSGSFWCLSWWGDSWHWSKGFLKAACAFMAVMLAFHVPRNWKLPKPVHAFIGCLPGLGSLWLLLLR